MRIRKLWIDAIHRAATGTRRTRNLLTPVGATIFGVFTAMFVAAGLLVDGLLRLPGLLPEGLRLPVSIPVMVVGTAITAWSVLHFLKVEGTPVPFNPPPTLKGKGAIKVKVPGTELPIC